MSTIGEARGVSGSWPSCIVLRRFVIRHRFSRALASRVVSTSTFSLATLCQFCSVGISAAKRSASWTGSQAGSGLLATTVSVASVSGDSVGVSTGVVLSAGISLSTIGCSCFGGGCCAAPICVAGWGECVDNSPVPGVSVSGSCVAGGDGGVGRWLASECALTLGGRWLSCWAGASVAAFVLDLDGKVVLASPVVGGLAAGKLADVWDCVGCVGRLSAIVRCLIWAKAAGNSIYCLSWSATCCGFVWVPFGSCGVGSWGACMVCFSWGRSCHLFGFGGVGGCNLLAGWEGLSLSRRGWISFRSSGGYAFSCLR